MMLVLRTLARKPQTKIALFSERISISLKKDYEFRCFSQLYAGYIHVLPHKKSPSRLKPAPVPCIFVKRGSKREREVKMRVCRGMYSPRFF